MVRRNDYIQKVDQFIGGKIYSLRLAKGLSRQQLAEVIEVTHQQLQKYEKGINRISIGRLVLIAKALDKNIDYFYQGLEDADNVEPVLTQHQRMCIEVSRNFMKIRNSEHQQAVNALIRSLIKED
ncbi:MULTISPECIES: helix-turn-helix domain-containing protein [unclassified Candidatus Tisiphia]|jgi:transcriptional regulator with XRE-family HTH domain|uniref:Helix-turn-helix transcriptional regulator n=1 Tax=Candidatus Tisiphia endosymbiont of Sergentomyia squamirostris TaxID=3113639 RepID=A0AAT9G9S1_9RICK|nr:helix-turn-helix transcriptional regulator [Rickettsiaceae bacterium]MDD9336907.1 helix-turn-helix transcriptional regulator [Rickettsiaceae bacterium]MDR0774569.1 helix-turn-helix domain-containing protein [Rickettsia sp.]UCM92839.1 MAG: helix-turn-helix domain-containing protein [Rickettsia endosymbiont of Cimex lectularius]